MNDLTLRPAKPSEIPRVVSLFGNVPLPPQAQVVVAARSVPVERLVGAIAVWVEKDQARFHLALQPGTARDAVARELIQHAAVNFRTASIPHLVYSEMLLDSDERVALLRANGFKVLRSEKFFRVSCPLAIARVNELMEKHRTEIPANWRSESIRHHPPEAVLNLVAPYGLLSPENLRRLWDPTNPQGFEPDMSSILFEEGWTIGTLLSRRTNDLLFYDIRVVSHPNRRLRALANLRLFHFNVSKYDPAYPLTWLQFRGDENEHRETANLARRMGGEEMPPRHMFSKEL